MQGTIAVTDHGWYDFLSRQPDLDEVNFWKPSARRAFNAPEFSPFFFKLKSPHNAICGFAWFARYARLPIWLAWEAFGTGNGCHSLREMEARLAAIRARIRFDPDKGRAGIGCILLVQPIFFEPVDWIQQPKDWPARTVGDKKYDLTLGEGARVWAECHALATSYRYRRPQSENQDLPVAAEPAPRYGAPTLVRPRLGQGTFRIAVSEAYEWGCAITGEHSQPALEAAHIKPYADDGPHEVSNGLLLRADFHRLFDTGYLTVTPEWQIIISQRLREDFQNGHSYYPFHGKVLRGPSQPSLMPSTAHLQWHNNNVFRG